MTLVEEWSIPIKELPEKIKKLSKRDFAKLLHRFDEVYYLETKESIPDDVYDTLRDLYEVFHGKYSPKKLNKSGKEVVKFDYHLGSLDKLRVGQVKQLNNWLSKYQGPYIVSEKLDGLGAIFENTKNGTELYTQHGTVVTDLLKYINCPDVEQEITVRGELIMSKDDFEKLNGEYAHPRGAVGGVVNGKTVSKRKNRAKKTKFIAYEIITLNSKYPKMNIKEQLDMLHELGFEIAEHILFSEIDDETLTEVLDNMNKTSKFEIDGIVVNDNNYCKRVKSGNPKHAFAYKYPATGGMVTEVTEVEWRPSKSGKLVPRIHFRPFVDHTGSTNTKATGFNAKFIKDNSIGPGTELQVIKSGDIIPYITSVITKSKEPSMPEGIGETCQWNETGVDLILVDKDVQEVKIKGYVHFFSALEIESIKQKTLEKMYDAGLEELTDILNADVEDFMKMKNTKKRSADIYYNNIINGIKDVPLPKLMGAFPGFGHGLGERKFKPLIEMFPDFLEWDFHEPDFEEDIIGKIIQVEGYSTKLAKRVLEGIVDFLEFLDECPVSYTIPEKIVVDDDFVGGKNIVFTGFTGKDGLKDLVESRGGSVKSSVSKNTDLVVAVDPDSTSGKIEKAKKYGIEIISKELFEEKMK